MKQNNRKKLSTKLIQYIIVSSVAVFIIFSVSELYFGSKYLVSSSLKSAQGELGARVALARGLLNIAQSDILFLSNIPEITELANAEAGTQEYESSRNRLELEYALEAGIRGIYHQIRYIDKLGNEIVRVNFTNGRAEIVDREELQNKGSRYYFQEAMDKRPGEIYISRIDLNREGPHQDISIPYTPVIRYATKIIDRQGIEKGIVIINVSAQDIVDALRSKSYQGMLVDQDGYYLYHDDEKYMYGGHADLAHGISLYTHYPKIAKFVLETQDGTIRDAENFLVFEEIGLNTTTNTKLTAIEAIPQNVILNQARLTAARFVGFGVLIMLILIVLVKRITEKTLEPLSEIATSLETLEKNNFNLELPTGSTTELEKLTEGLRYMVARLKSLYQTMDHTISEQTASLRNQLDDINKFKLAVNNSYNAIYFTDVDGIVTFANERSLQLTGFPRSEVVGRKAGAAWGGNMSKEFYKNMWDTIKVKKQPYEGVLVNRKKDGTQLYIQLNITPILDEKNEIKMFVAIQNDLTKIRKAQEEMQRSNEIFENAFTHAAIGFALVSPEGKFLKVNKALTDIVDYSEKELLTKTFQDITHPEDLEKDLEQMKKLAGGEIDDYQMEKRYIRKSGEHVWIQLNGSVVRKDDGTPDFYIAQILDINERKNFEEKLKEVDETKSKFITIIAHQLRTPLASVKWNLEMMLDGDFGKLKKEQETFLRAMYDAESNAIERLEDLFTVMDITDGKLALSLEKTSLRTLFETVKNTFKKRVTNKKLTFMEYVEDIPEISVDRNKITKVFEELIENAIDYTPEGGNISVKLEVDGNKVVFTIQDTGIGVPTTERNRVFEKFFRAPNAYSVATDRSGVGLYIANSYVLLHGGEMGLDSEEDKGTTVWFKLPLAVESII